MVAAEGHCGSQFNAANKQCSTASLSVNMAGGCMTEGAIGAAVQLVYNNNNELIAQQGENKTKVKSSKKVLKKFYKNLKQFLKRFKKFLKNVIKVSKKLQKSF